MCYNVLKPERKRALHNSQYLMRYGELNDTQIYTLYVT